MNPATGQKVTDYLTVVRRGEVAPGTARDFSLADVELSLYQPRVLLNGKPVEATANFQNATAGAVVWLYLAGHGRFVLSLFPNEKLGFQKNGVAAAHAFVFREGSTEYRFECANAVAPGSGQEVPRVRRGGHGGRSRGAIHDWLGGQGGVGGGKTLGR